MRFSQVRFESEINKMRHKNEIQTQCISQVADCAPESFSTNLEELRIHGNLKLWLANACVCALPTKNTREIENH